MGSRAAVLEGPINITGLSFLFRSLKNASVAYAPLAWRDGKLLTMSPTQEGLYP